MANFPVFIDSSGAATNSSNVHYQPVYVIQIHGFCDVSSVGYAAVVYIRSLDSQAKVAIRLVVATCKVAALKSISIPRIELCAAVLISDFLALSKRPKNRVCTSAISMS